MYRMASFVGCDGNHWEQWQDVVMVDETYRECHVALVPYKSLYVIGISDFHTNVDGHVALQP
jgi:hypothetical protein